MSSPTPPVASSRRTRSPCSTPTPVTPKKAVRSSPLIRCSSPGRSRASPSRARRQVRVRVTTSTGDVSDWSDPLDVEVGLLGSTDWTAVPITATFPDTPPERPIRFRRDVRRRARDSCELASTHPRSGSTPSSATARRSVTKFSRRAGRATTTDSVTRRSTSRTPSTTARTRWASPSPRGGTAAGSASAADAARSTAPTRVRSRSWSCVTRTA